VDGSVFASRGLGFKKTIHQPLLTILLQRFMVAPESLVDQQRQPHEARAVTSTLAVELCDPGHSILSALLLDYLWNEYLREHASPFLLVTDDRVIRVGDLTVAHAQ
jgi:hypothetical protein